MITINKNLNKTTADDWEQIYNIKFEFTKGKYNSMNLQNAIAFDTESSNGFQIPESNKVIAFEQEKYDRGILKTHKKNKEDIDFNDEDVKYMMMLDSCKPVGLMYVWQVAIEDGQGGIKAFIGRTWEEFQEFQIMLSNEVIRQSSFGFKSINRERETEKARASKNRIALHWFAHNLGHDWQFMRSIYNDDFAYSKSSKGNVFARKNRKPMKAIMNLNSCKFVYHDTASLAQKSLRDWAKDCPNCPLQKLDDFDYLTIKTPYDKLTDEEIHYAINDVLIIVYCIEYERNEYKKLENIPMTATGKVRRVCQDRICKPNPAWAVNCSMIAKGYTPEEYKKRVQTYTGGWTHANAMKVGKVYDCKCFDFASSYPSVLCNGKYAIFGYEECSVGEFDELSRQDVEDPDFRWFARIKFWYVQSCLQNTYFSSSKCIALEDACIDNGRIAEAEYMEVYLSDLDYHTFKQAYTWKEMEVVELQKGQADYLPAELIKTTLDYYAKKTTLKGIKEKESEYVSSKGFINSIYGVFVYKQISDVVVFNADGWTERKIDEEGDSLYYELIKEISDENLFGFFDIGSTISAIARKRLWDFIAHFDKKIVYCDTDSIKGEFDDEDLKWVEEYNKWIEERENEVADKLGFDRDMFCPKTSKGVPKRLGIMEREEDCKLKTLGAKRYVAEHDGVIECTIAGLPKSAGAMKIKSFDDFNNNTLWTTKESEKVCAYYNDNQGELVWTGRDGKEYVSHDQYGVCLKPVTFDLSMSGEFITFLNTLFNEEIDWDNPLFGECPNYLKV